MLSKNALYNGLFLGIALIIASFSFYLANPELYLQTKPQLLFVPFLILLFKTGSDAKRIAGGYIDFATLFKEMFIASAIGTFMCISFGYILFNFIDPELKTMMYELQRELMVEQGVEENLFSKMLLDRMKSGEFFSITGAFIEFILKLIAPCALMSSMFGLILKRKKQLP